MVFLMLFLLILISLGMGAWFCTLDRVIIFISPHHFNATYFIILHQTYKLQSMVFVTFAYLGILQLIASKPCDKNVIICAFKSARNNAVRCFRLSRGCPQSLSRSIWPLSWSSLSHCLRPGASRTSYDTHHLTSHHGQTNGQTTSYCGVRPDLQKNAGHKFPGMDRRPTPGPVPNYKCTLI